MTGVAVPVSTIAHTPSSAGIRRWFADRSVRIRVVAIVVVSTVVVAFLADDLNRRVEQFTH